MCGQGKQLSPAAFLPSVHPGTDPSVLVLMPRQWLQHRVEWGEVIRHPKNHPHLHPICKTLQTGAVLVMGCRLTHRMLCVEKEGAPHRHPYLGTAKALGPAMHS